MKYESLIFDIDGTLWDSRALVAEGYNAQLKKEGLEHLCVDAERLKSLFETKLITKIIQVVDLDAFLEEVKTVRKFELIGLEQELEFNEDVSVGDRFMIQNGVWEGVTGWLTCRDKKFKWTVQLEFINEMITTTIDPSKFKMLKL